MPLPLYLLDYYEQPPLREFFASHKSSVTKAPDWSGID
jgi:hypothetical protein